MNYSKLIICLFICAFIGTISAHAQEPSGPPSKATTTPDTSKVEILDYTKQLTFRTINDTTKLTIIAGTVKMRQGNTLFFCDSCVINNNSNVFEAWGNVKIIDADTATVTSNHLRYLTQRKLAYLDGNVKLTDGHATLTTPDMEYDMETNIGTYKNGGKVINGKTELTSREGYYFSEPKDFYFKKNVVLKDPAYNIVTDSLFHNTVTKETRFISMTTIKDSSGRIIKTKEGYYNQQTGKAQFSQRPEIIDGDLSIRGNTVTTNDSTGVYIAEGNAIVRNLKDGTTTIGGIIIANKKTEAFLATRKPLMIIKQDKDSIYISADTLFSAKLTSRFGMDSIIVDTVKGTRVAAFNEKDSTNRYFEAYSHVRIFNDSLQAAGDSLFYSFRDSIFRLYKNPVLWAQKSQITGDTILIHTKNKKADRLEAFENSFMVNEVEKDIYNQIKSSRLDGWFVDGNIDSVRALGLAECVYYIQDEDSAYTGINQSKSDIIDIYFAQKELERVVFRSEVTGTLWPIREKGPQEMQLAGFQWLEDRRPKSKLEMYE
jgi:lipopolysaccharide export system protein LptA